MTGDQKSRDPRLERVTAASLTDAMGRRHVHRAHALDFLSPTPERILFGKAVTIRFLPQRMDIHDPERHNFARQFYEAIGGEQPSGAGKVLVMSSSGHYDTSVAGSTKLSRLENHGLQGVLTDGRLRDFAALGQYTFASWCTGEAVRWGGDVLMPCEEVNVPVSLKNVVIVTRRGGTDRRGGRALDRGDSTGKPGGHPPSRRQGDLTARLVARPTPAGTR